MNDVREYVDVTMREADDKRRMRLAFPPLASLALFPARGERVLHSRTNT